MDSGLCAPWERIVIMLNMMIKASELKMINHPLINILRDHLKTEKTAPFDTDWAALFNLANKHEVAAIVYSQCNNFIPQECIEEFERTYSAAVFYYANRKKLLDKVETVLADIEHFIVKGPSIAQFYPIPALRTMGDTDIVIHDTDREKIDRRLTLLGPKHVQRNNEYEWHYKFYDMDFEVHDHLIYDEVISKRIYKDYFNGFWKYVNDNELDWNYHFLFLILHLRKHFMNTGVGIRQFMDIAVLTTYGPQLDWMWIETELKKLDLWIFTERVLALNECWFSVKPPLPIEQVSPAFLSSATDLVLKNGVFGFDNRDNKENAVVNAIRGKKYSGIAMLGLAVRKLFPDYQSMLKEAHYSYLNNLPYLLAFAWIHRFGRTIINRRIKQNMAILNKTSFTDSQTINRRETVYQDWGL